MRNTIIKELDVKRFNVFVGYTRSPMVEYFSEELKWFSNENETIIGVLLIDLCDNNYSCVILGRDEGGRFRAFNQCIDILTENEAIEWIKEKITTDHRHGNNNFPQGDNLKKGLDLFNPVVSAEKQHPYFIKLNSDVSFSPAKHIINEIMPHFIDIDGNFVEQFQSTGFDSRLWELYLNSYLNEERLFINRDYKAPDFIVNKYGEKIAIEAVIVGRKDDNPPHDFKILSITEINDETENKMPIRFGSPLYSKLKKKYWELPQIKDCPLVFAIADFHDDLSMMWSSTSIINYLYGIKHDYYYNKNNELVIIPTKIISHKDGKKEIPSGFFSQPDTENISAVIFSAIGTISKFNRIGKQAGFGDKDVLLIRNGVYHDHNSNASVPKKFQYVVDINSSETWAEGMSMFHNPNALKPVEKKLFPSIAHHEYINGQIMSLIPEFHPYSSYTLNMKINGK